MTFIVHNLAHAIAALTAAAEADAPVTLLSPPEAAKSLGVGMFLAIIAAARAALPEAKSEAVLDCGDAPGLALGALRAGAEAVTLRASPETRAKVADIAGQTGARLIEPEEAFDLLPAHDPLASARRFLGLT